MYLMFENLLMYNLCLLKGGKISYLRRHDQLLFFLLKTLKFWYEKFKLNFHMFMGSTLKQNIIQLFGSFDFWFYFLWKQTNQKVIWKESQNFFLVFFFPSIFSANRLTYSDYLLWNPQSAYCEYDWDEFNSWF